MQAPEHRVLSITVPTAGEGADVSTDRFGVAARTAEQHVPRPLALLQRCRPVVRVVQQQRGDGARAVRRGNAAGHRGDAPDSLRPGAGEAVGERGAERMADHVDGVQIDAVGGSDPLQNDVKEGIIPQRTWRVAGIRPREPPGSVGQRRRVDEDGRSVRRFLEPEVAPRTEVIVGPAVEGQDQHVRSAGAICLRQNDERMTLPPSHTERLRRLHWRRATARRRLRGNGVRRGQTGGAKCSKNKEEAVQHGFNPGRTIFCSSSRTQRERNDVAHGRSRSRPHNSLRSTATGIDRSHRSRLSGGSEDW